jgi:hypothetical protein
MLYYNQKERKTQSKEREDTTMKNWKVWILTDKEGKELARGRKKNVMDVLYQRYVYGHIFTDNLYRTSELLKAEG